MQFWPTCSSLNWDALTLADCVVIHCLVTKFTDESASTFAEHKKNRSAGLLVMARELV